MNPLEVTSVVTHSIKPHSHPSRHNKDHSKPTVKTPENLHPSPKDKRAKNSSLPSSQTGNSLQVGPRDKWVIGANNTQKPEVTPRKRGGRNRNSDRSPERLTPVNSRISNSQRSLNNYFQKLNTTPTRSRSRSRLHDTNRSPEGSREAQVILCHPYVSRCQWV